MNEQTKILRRLRLTNHFDSACNHVLLRIFPIANAKNPVLVNSYAALEYAKNSLKEEKMILKELKLLALERNKMTPDLMMFLLNLAMENQRERHVRMKEIMEGKVR